ncbi:hypothetical protein [Chondrinema litorale]|uniref:hypothetical protein n=1 Tax=Chondrinema litorale TaxID=2994555 RepID=UPI002543AD3E|nr:hypothetical protein [Chondrinema litorale]UZR93403.1 hypothetical protein OQ292_16230 [Chondrinema litorale]
MKFIAILFFSVISLNVFAQSELEIKVSDLPVNKGNIAPANISVSEDDILDLGITFIDQDLVTEVHFSVTDAVLNFSHTNNYLIEYNRNDQLIEFGCLIPSEEKGVFRMNEKLFIPIERELDAISGPISQGE